MKSKLDHHVGKAVETVDTEGAVWNLILEDGTKITNHKRSKKPEVVGLKLMVVEQKKSDDKTTYKLHFGKANSTEQVVEVESGSYEINGEDPHEEVAVEIPADPSPERVQDEPEGGWEALAQRELENAEG